MRNRLSIVAAVMLAVLLSWPSLAAPPKSKLVQESREPKGLRLRWFSLLGKPLPEGAEAERVLWPWGSQKADVLAKLGTKNKPYSTQSSDELDGVEYCFFLEFDAGTWYADFGEDFFPVAASFFKGEFYSFSVDFPTDKFPFVKRTLAAALGMEGLSTRSTVSNRMGAEFDQENVVWASENVLVTVEQRASTVDKGNMVVTYRPILAKAPKEPKAGAAPF